MDKLFSIDVYQTLSYLMPGLALLIPIYFINSTLINSTLEKLGLVTAVVLLFPVALSIGIFLHALSAFAQSRVERITHYDMVKRTIEKFEHTELLRARIKDTYGISIASDENYYYNIYVYSRTITAKDSAPLRDRAQLFSSLSVFCRSLILVTLIVGSTVIWRRFNSQRFRGLDAALVSMAALVLLIYMKEMYFRLAIQEDLRAALILTAPKTERGSGPGGKTSYGTTRSAPESALVRAMVADTLARHGLSPRMDEAYAAERANMAPAGRS